MLSFITDWVSTMHTLHIIIDDTKDKKIHHHEEEIVFSSYNNTVFNHKSFFKKNTNLYCKSYRGLSISPTTPFLKLPLSDGS